MNFFRDLRCWTIVFLGFVPVHGASTAPMAPAVTVPLQPRYFFTVDLDPRYQIVGTGPIDPEAAKMANCYEFTYGAQGRTLRIDYLRAGRPTADPFFQVERIDFEYAPGIERRWYRDSDDKPAKDLGGISGEELTLNSAGYVTSVTNLSGPGQTTRDAAGVIRYQRTLDAQGRLVAGRRVGLLGSEITDNDGLFETRTTYDPQGRRIEYGNYDAKGNPLNNSEGIALVRTTYTSTPGSAQIIESYFDASGVAAEEKSSGIHVLQREVDDRGLLLSESYGDAAGAPTVDTTRGIHERRCQYDERGNLLTEQFFDIDGRPKNLRTFGYAEVVYKYDALNRVIERDYFGDDGTPQVLTNLGAAIIRQEYDADGNMIRRQFFDGQGNPSLNSHYLAPAIRVQVQGKRTFVTLRDAQDRPMANPVNGYAAFSYLTATQEPLDPSNKFYNLRGKPMSRLRVFIINPHLHALATTPVMQASARGGAAAAALGAFLAAIIALRKAGYVRRRQVYVPATMERFFGWLAIFLIGEGMIRFFLTIYWAWVGYQNGRMGYGIYLFEAAFILFFLYRLQRLRVTMRVLNIRREDASSLLLNFFAKAHLQPEVQTEHGLFITPPLTVRLRYFAQKFHVYLALRRHGKPGKDLARALKQNVRVQARALKGPEPTQLLGRYYPSVAVCYFLLSLIGLYTFWQLVK